MQRLESLPNLVYLDTRLMVQNHDSRATGRPDSHEALAFEASLSFTNRSTAHPWALVKFHSSNRGIWLELVGQDRVS